MVESNVSQNAPFHAATPLGLEALYLACRKIYPDQPNPLQVSALVKYWLGGPDPLDYISMYSNPGDIENGICPHWHYISFGLSDLHGDGRVHEKLDSSGLSGFGFELTFRLKREPSETAPPTWPATLLQALAKYVFHSGNLLCSGDHVSWPCALDSSESRIQHMLLTKDAQLDPIDTPFGKVNFIQVVGITKEELQAAQRWNGTGVLDILKNIPGGSGGGFWLVTDMRRGESMFELDLNASSILEAGIQTDGSNLSGVTATCSWIDTSINQEDDVENLEGQGHDGSELFKKQPTSLGRKPNTFPFMTHCENAYKNYDCDLKVSPELTEAVNVEAVHLTFNYEAGCLLPLAIGGRVKHGRHFTFKSVIYESAITLVAESVTGSFVDIEKPYVAHGLWLQVLIPDDFASLMLEELQHVAFQPLQIELPKTFHWPERKISITIVPDNPCADI